MNIWFYVDSNTNIYFCLVHVRRYVFVTGINKRKYFKIGNIFDNLKLNILLISTFKNLYVATCIKLCLL